MIPSLAVMDEEFQEFGANFHIGLEANRRSQLPQEDVGGVLLEGKRQDLAATIYAVSSETDKQRLEELIERALVDIARGGFKKTIRIGDSQQSKEFKVVSYERDPRTNVLYATESSAKDFEKFWQKSIYSILIQNETGHMDYQRFRIIVEHQEAREFRTHRGYERLSPAEKRRYDTELKNKFFKGKKYRDLSPEERKRFYREFTVDYWDLTPKEKEIYKKRFREKNRKICRDIASKIANNPSLDTIPLNPHYMTLDGLDLRAQRQAVSNSQGQMILEIEYLLCPDAADNKLFERALKSACWDYDYGIEQKTENTARYVDHNGLHNRLERFGNLVVNVRVHDSSIAGSLDYLVRSIGQRYEAAVKKFAGEEDIDERENRVMEAIKLEMPDVRGFFVYAETTTTDLENKYAGISVNPSKSAKAFVKDRIGQKAEKDNKFENAKVYVRFRDVSGECQVMDPIMFEAEQTGEAKKEGDIVEYFNRKALRTGKSHVKITWDDINFGRAHFMGDEESNNLFSQIYADLSTKSIDKVVDELAALTLIPKQDAGDRTEFEKLMGEMKRVYAIAQRASPAHLEKVTAAVNRAMDAYIENKGRSFMIYAGSLFEISQSLREASQQLNAEFRHFANEIFLYEALHKRHIKMLYDTFVELAQSDNVRHVAASLFVGLLIRHYDKYYHGALPSGNEYAALVRQFGAGREGWEMYKCHGKELGYIPSKFRTRDAIKKAIMDESIFTNTPIAEFDRRTISDIRRVYESKVKQA